MESTKCSSNCRVVIFLFFNKFLEDASPFCGATDTPFFWLLVMSPLGFEARVGSALFELSRSICVMLHIPLFELGRGVCVTCSLRFTSGVIPADLLAASMAAEPSLPHTCKALVGLETGSYHAAAHNWRVVEYSSLNPNMEMNLCLDLQNKVVP